LLANGGGWQHGEHERDGGRKVKYAVHGVPHRLLIVSA
jgi:hypothetical protein